MFSKPKLIPGRYTKGPFELVGEVRYLDPDTGVLYEDGAGGMRVNSGFTHSGGGVWSAAIGWEFAEDKRQPVKPAPCGYLVCSPNGPFKGLHPTREEAEQRAVRLAKSNVAVEFTVVPVHLGAPVAKAYTPKPKPTLERLYA